jgi:hypothetical protein
MLQPYLAIFRQLFTISKGEQLSEDGKVRLKHVAVDVISLPF